MGGWTYIASALLIGLAGAAEAQDVAFDPAGTEACLAGLDRTADKRVCVGTSARMCARDADTGACMEAEISYWEARMEAGFAMAFNRADGKDSDAHHMKMEPRNQAQALKDAQDNWSAYRAATCAFEQTLWGDGQADAPEVRACHLYLIAEQTFYLEAVALIE